MRTEERRAATRATAAVAAMVIVLVLGGTGVYYLVAASPPGPAGNTPSGSKSTSAGGSSTGASSGTYSTASSAATSTSSTSSDTGTTSSASTGSSGSSTGNWSFNGQWYGLRGVAYPWQVFNLKPDQRGSPDPQWSFAQFRSLGWNLVRIDGLSWGEYQSNATLFMSNIAKVVNAANANGVYVIWEFSSANPRQDLPPDLSGALAAWWPYWWNDQAYNGNQVSLQGLPIWRAWFQGFVLPVMSAVDSQPCTLGYKFTNEPQHFPSSNALGYLASFFASMGSQARAAGFVKDLVYTGPGGHPGVAGLINQIQPLMASGSYKPAIYEVHYWGTDPTSFSNDVKAASVYGVVVWDGEEASSFFTQSNLQTLRADNVPVTVFRWDEDGNLLAYNGCGLSCATATSTLTQTALGISSLENQVLGRAYFFS